MASEPMGGRAAVTLLKGFRLPVKDTGWRCLIKRLAWWRYAIDLRCTRWLQRLHGETPFVLEGRCTGCGECCRTPMINIPGPWFHLRSFRWLVTAWHRLVNGFVPVGIDIHEHTLIFRCTHFDPNTRRCDSYATRPGMCRDYPRNLLNSPAPELLPGCGFEILARDAETLRATLRELDLPPDKLAEVERRFYVSKRRNDHDDRHPPAAAT